MPRTTLLVALAALALAPAGVRAEDTASEPAPATSTATGGGALSSGWLLNGATVGAGRNYLFGEIGWPGLNLSLLHGVSEKFDVGGTFSFVYGLEGMAETSRGHYFHSSAIAPGFKLNAILKLNLANKDKFNLGLRLNPGLAIYFPSAGVYYSYLYDVRYRSSTTMFGIQFPLEILVGIVPIRALSIHLGIAMPMVLFFVPDFSFIFPIQPGFGVEYKVDSSLVLTLDTRYGPSFVMAPNTTHTEFSFRVQFGLGYRF